jgi:hypothetical protein
MAANKTVAKAESVVNENSSEKAKELLSEAQAAYQEGDLFEARNKATSAISQANVNTFRDMSREQVRNEYRDELNDLKASVSDVKELNQKMAQKLQEAETQEERLAIIEDFKEERKEIRSEIREEARDRAIDRMPGNMPEDRDEADEKDSDDTSDNESSEDEEEGLELGESEVEIEGEDSAINSKMRYKAKNAGYSVNTNSNANDMKVTFDYEISSSNGAAAQVITDLNAKASKSDLSPGNYTAKAVVSVDGETINTVTEEVEITG